LNNKKLEKDSFNKNKELWKIDIGKILAVVKKNVKKQIKHDRYIKAWAS